MAINDFKKEEELFLSSLSYLTIGLIGIFSLTSDMKNYEYLQFHAKRSIVYWLFSILIWIITSSIFHFLYIKCANIPNIGLIFYYIWRLFYIGFGFFIILYAFYLSYLAYNGKKKRLYLYEKILYKIGVNL